MGIATSALSKINAIQGMNLLKEIKKVTTLMNTMKESIDLHNSQIFQLSMGEIKLVETLHHTQTHMMRNRTFQETALLFYNN